MNGPENSTCRCPDCRRRSRCGAPTRAGTPCRRRPNPDCGGRCFQHHECADCLDRPDIACRLDRFDMVLRWTCAACGNDFLAYADRVLAEAWVRKWETEADR